MLFKRFRIIILFLFVIACKVPKENQEENIKEKYVRTNLFALQPDVMVISCIRCSCFDKDLPDAYRKDSLFFKRIYIVADSTCGIRQLLYQPVQQSRIDELSEDFFNIILLRKTGTGNEYKYRIIQTKESRNLLDIAKSFFRE